MNKLDEINASIYFGFSEEEAKSFHPSATKIAETLFCLLVGNMEIDEPKKLINYDFKIYSLEDLKGNEIKGRNIDHFVVVIYSGGEYDIINHHTLEKYHFNEEDLLIYHDKWSLTEIDNKTRNSIDYHTKYCCDHFCVTAL